MSSSGMSLIGESMNRPTMTRAGQTAEPGMAVNRGAKNMARAKHTATEKAVRPERPPCATPDALSTYVVTVLVPSKAPATVPTASAMKAWLSLFGLPFSSTMLALVVTPTRVPIVSNMSTNRKVKTTTSMSRLKICDGSVII